MTPRAALEAALPERAAAALALARAFDPSCDPATAWLAAQSLPTASPTRLARRIRAATRRDRRAGGARGPARFVGLDDLDQASKPGGDDPAEIIAACQTLAKRPDLAAAMAEREPAGDTRVLAQRDGCTQRRIQQVLASVRGLEAAGQGVLL